MCARYRLVFLKPLRRTGLSERLGLICRLACLGAKTTGSQWSRRHDSNLRAHEVRVPGDGSRLRKQLQVKPNQRNSYPIGQILGGGVCTGAGAASRRRRRRLKKAQPSSGCAHNLGRTITPRNIPNVTDEHGQVGGNTKPHSSGTHISEKTAHGRITTTEPTCAKAAGETARRMLHGIPVRRSRSCQSAGATIIVTGSENFVPDL